MIYFQVDIPAGEVTNGIRTVFESILLDVVSRNYYKDVTNGDRTFLEATLLDVISRAYFSGVEDVNEFILHIEESCTTISLTKISMC